MRKLTGFVSAFVAAGLLAACGDGPTGTNEGDALSAVEVQALFDELSAALAAVNLGFLPSPQLVRPNSALSVASPISLDASFDETVPCEMGSIRLAGSLDGQVDDETFAGDVTIDFTWDFDGCVVSTENASFTVNGDPEIVFTADFSFSQESFTVEGSQGGGFRFTASDGREGRCAIDISFSSSVDASTGQGSGSVTGSVCGMDASQFNTFDF